nr:hypothetical protein [Tanacetum cinerariifolium]
MIVMVADLNEYKNVWFNFREGSLFAKLSFHLVVVSYLMPLIKTVNWSDLSEYLLKNGPTHDTTKKETLTSSRNCSCYSLMTFSCDRFVLSTPIGQTIGLAGLIFSNNCWIERARVDLFLGTQNEK